MDETSYRALLDAQDWGDVYARVLDFAEHRCKKRKDFAKDLAAEAVARIYAFDSKWDPEKEPDVARYLMSVVNSLLYNERHTYAAKHNVSMETKKGARAAAKVGDPRAWSADKAAETDLLARRLELLRERMVDDPQVLALIEATERGLDEPAELRARLAWTANKLLAVRRRMLRAAALVARDLGGAGDDEIPIDEEEDEEEVA